MTFYYILVNLDAQITLRRLCHSLTSDMLYQFFRKYGIDINHSPVVGDVKKIYGGYCMRILQNKILASVKISLGNTLGQHLCGGLKQCVVVFRQKLGTVIGNLSICKC